MYVEIKTKRLLLRPLRAQTSPNVRQYIGVRKTPVSCSSCKNFTKDETRQFLSEEAGGKWISPDFTRFAVMLSGKHIGIGSVSLRGRSAAELGWILNKDYWKEVTGWKPPSR